MPVSEENSLVREYQDGAYTQVIPKENRRYIIMKRSLDIVCACLGLIILGIIFLFVAIFIKFEDRKGPIFFKQTRVGLGGKTFNMYKFRSMVSNAEELKEMLKEKNEATGPVFKMKNDPRITKIGRFIRKTSIDELPQLFNVLKGEMSLVGPRPPLPSEVELYSSYEYQRLQVVPGLTCYWQVSGRSKIGFEEWVELDLKYIRERSMIVDIKLILKTVPALLGTKDAY